MMLIMQHILTGNYMLCRVTCSNTQEGGNRITTAALTDEQTDKFALFGR